MSEFTFAILTKNSDLVDLNRLKKMGMSKAYILPVNNLWTAILLEDIFEAEVIAKKISEQLGKYTFDFSNCEDHGWKYKLFFEGRELAFLEVDYENQNAEELKIKLEKANLPILREIGGDEYHLYSLKDYILNYQRQRERLFEGVEHFKKAFNFEKVTWLSFHLLSQYNESERNSARVIEIQAKSSIKDKILETIGFTKDQKKINPKKMIKDNMSKVLMDKGYEYDKNNPLAGDYAFFRKENGFRVGLQFFLQENTLGVELKTHIGEYDLFYKTGTEPGPRYYYTEQELKEILNEVLNLFLNKGEEIINEERLENFNASEIYVQTLDHQMMIHSFERVYMDDNLLVGGQVIYRRNSTEIKLKHGFHRTTVGCYVSVNGREQKLVRLVPGLGNTPVGYSYKNRQEYEQILKKFYYYLETYFIPTLK